MLSVFGVLPRSARTRPSPNHITRQHSIEDAKNSVLQEQSKLRIAFALRHTEGPKAKTMSQRLQYLPSGSPVLVYRTKTKICKGPVKFISVDKQAAVLQLQRVRNILRTKIMKPCVKPNCNYDQACTTRPEENPTEIEQYEQTLEVKYSKDKAQRIARSDDPSSMDLGDKQRKFHVKKRLPEKQAFASSLKFEL